MRLQVQVHRITMGRREFRVIRPRPAPVRMALRDDHHWLSMYTDRQAAGQLLALWALAARSTRSMVYLPIRANPAPMGVVADGEPVALDLVLLHHSLQFPSASWKQLRARLGVGRVHGAVVPEHDFAAESEIDYQRRDHQGYRDHLGFDIAAHTLFLVGSPTAFREQGTALRGLVEEAPSYLHRYPAAGHYCVELCSGTWSNRRTRRNVPAALHIQYCDSWRI